MQSTKIKIRNDSRLCAFAPLRETLRCAAAIPGQVNPVLQRRRNEGVVGSEVVQDSSQVEVFAFFVADDLDAILLRQIVVGRLRRQS